jgi:hypothetical protein
MQSNIVGGPQYMEVIVTTIVVSKDIYNTIYF